YAGTFRSRPGDPDEGILPRVQNSALFRTGSDARSAGKCTKVWASLSAAGKTGASHRSDTQDRRRRGRGTFGISVSSIRHFGICGDSESHNRFPGAIKNKRNPIIDVELAKDRGQVVRNSSLADIEALGNLLIFQSLTYQLNHFLLPRSDGGNFAFFRILR